MSVLPRLLFELQSHGTQRSEARTKGGTNSGKNSVRHAHWSRRQSGSQKYCVALRSAAREKQRATDTSRRGFGVTNESRTVGTNAQFCANAVFAVFVCSAASSTTGPRCG